MVKKDMPTHPPCALPLCLASPRLASPRLRTCSSARVVQKNVSQATIFQNTERVGSVSTLYRCAWGGE